MYSSISSKFYIVKKISEWTIFLVGKSGGKKISKICRSATWLR